VTHPPKYRGVSWHKRREKWRAGFKIRDTHLYLGCYHDPEIAAWCVDFARYLLFGLHPAKWHPKVGRPNGPPRDRPDFPRFVILSKVADAGLLPPEVLEQRLAEYDKSCAS